MPRLNQNKSIELKFSKSEIEEPLMRVVEYQYKSLNYEYFGNYRVKSNAKNNHINPKSKYGSHAIETKNKLEDKLLHAIQRKIDRRNEKRYNKVYNLMLLGYSRIKIAKILRICLRTVVNDINEIRKRRDEFQITSSR